MSRMSYTLLVAAAGLGACSNEPTSSQPPLTADATAAAVAPAPGRLKWRFKLDGDYSLHSPGVGADGTVYVSLTGGKLYAIAPDGTQRWVFQTGVGGPVFGPVSVGTDGTIYTAGMVPAQGTTGNDGAIFALNPDGTRKWVFSATNQLLIAGPNVGPDGNIYAVTDFGGIGLFSLTPAGQLRFSVSGFTEYGAIGEEIAFGPGQLYFAFDMRGVGPPSLFSYDFNGGKRFQVFNAENNARPAVGPNGNVVLETFPTNIGMSLAAYAPSGSLLWNFYQFPGNTEEHPEVGPDNVIYTVRNLATVFALNPTGTVKWTYVDFTILFEPKVRPQNDLLFMGGRLNYGQPGFFLAVNTKGTPLWRVDLPDEPGFAPYGQLVPMTRPVFSPDGNTAYSVTDVAGDGANPYSFLYAIDLTPGTGGGNTPPVATLAATSPTTITHGGSVAFRANFTDPDVGDGPWPYTWFFGNGSTKGSAAAPGIIKAVRTYARAGTYRVKLLVTDARGAADTTNVIMVQVK